MKALVPLLLASLVGCAEAIADVQSHTVVLASERLPARAITEPLEAERVVISLRDGRAIELAGARLQRDGDVLRVESVGREPWHAPVDAISGLELQQVHLDLQRTRVQADDAGPTTVMLLGSVAVAFFGLVLLIQ